MRAYVMSRYGGLEGTHLQDVPLPEPQANDLLIRVRAAGLNPVDYKFREGGLKVLFRPKLPVVLGSELSGTVETCGPAVKGFAVGDRVFARVSKYGLGAFAQYACVDASLAAKVPESVDLTMAAGVPLAGLTALQCLRDELNVQPGQRLFISGGAGGVGTFALQLAKRFGAEVTTTASARGEALVRRLGADRVIDYTHERFWEVLKDMDGALDLVGGDTLDHCFEIVKRGGRVVSIAGLPEPETARRDLEAGPGLTALFWLISMKWRMLARRHGVTYRYKFMHPSGAQLAELADMIAKDELQIVVDRVFPFEAIGDAFAYLEKGRAKGKVIVTMEG